MSSFNVKKEKEIPIILLKEWFEIHGPDLVWRKTFKKMVAGKRAGNVNTLGYVDIGFQGQRYYAHRIAFAIYHDRWPEGVVDHIDHNRTNNNPSNLREASDSENNFNQKLHKRNKTGVKGLTKHCGGWNTEIRAFGIRHRKWFKSREDAEAHLEKLRKKLHGEFCKTG